MTKLERLAYAALLLPTPENRRAIRQSAGVTLQAVADELGVSNVTVSRWETGQREPHGDLLIRYVEVLADLSDVIRAVEDLGAGLPSSA